MADKLGTVTIVLKSGRELKFAAKSCSTEHSRISGEITKLSLEGGRPNAWLYLRLDSIEAVLWEGPDE